MISRSSQLRRAVRVCRREGSVLLRRLWFTGPFYKPSLPSILDIADRYDALGDTLLLTPALREIKRRNPNCRIRFYTNYPTLVNGLPYIDEVLPRDTASPAALRRGEYGQLLSYPLHLFWIGATHRAIRLPLPVTNVHLARLAGLVLGVRLEDIRPDCIIRPDLVQRWQDQWRDIPHPHVIISRKSKNPNKIWPDEYWEQFIDNIERSGGVIECGTHSSKTAKVRGPNYIDLRGRTSIDELVAAIAAADVHVGPDSGPIHVAAAVGTPSIIIYGGYLHPSNTAYLNNVGLFTPLHCSPCWLDDPCPYGKKCLSAISPGKVEEYVWAVWQRISQAEAFPTNGRDD